MNDGKKRQSPLALDMDFGEAIRRFANVRPAELEREMGNTGKAKRKAASVELSWTKKLSQTDAQQPTSGGIVPYLRLTKSSLQGEDFQTWFREGFFAPASWKPGDVGRETDVEVADIDMMVSVNGVKLGKKLFQVSHGPHRHEKHNTPNTWLHWPPEIQDMLHENDMTGWPVTLTRTADGSFSVDIQAASSED